MSSKRESQVESLKKPGSREGRPSYENGQMGSMVAGR